MSTLGLIEYENASPEVRAVYDDIMATRKTDWINNFWKAIAHDPATLKRTWEDIKQIMSPGALDPLTKELIYVAVDSPEELDGLDLTDQPIVTPLPPEGTNVEFVYGYPADSLSHRPDGTTEPATQVRMRVFERGVGETQSCGTGCCAAALAVHQWRSAQLGQAPAATIVSIPGGEVRVRLLQSGNVELAGPAVLTYSGIITV